MDPRSLIKNFSFFTLDAAEQAEKKPLSLAVGPNNRVGVAYFKKAQAPDDWEIRYVEWENGNVKPSELARTVQRLVGLSLAFQSSGEPAIAYLGGANESLSDYWFQSDAAVSYRSGGVWTEQVVVIAGGEALAPDQPNAVSDRGAVVGLNPGLIFGGSTAYLGYRDVHGAQFTNDGVNGSDLEVAEGGPTSWNKTCAIPGGNSKQAWGGHIQLVMAGDQPAMVSDQLFNKYEGGGQNIVFSRRSAIDGWAPQASKTILSTTNTDSGPSLAYDSQLGFAVAVSNRTMGELSYISSSDGASWSQPVPVFQSGSGGWYGSISIDPSLHEPSIAFYFCSPVQGVDEGECLEDEDEIRMATLINGSWRFMAVDPDGAYMPRLGTLSTGKRVVASRTRTGVLSLAVEK